MFRRKYYTKVYLIDIGCLVLECLVITNKNNVSMFCMHTSITISPQFVDEKIRFGCSTKTKTIDKVHFWKHIFREFDDITGTISIIM